jgi:hypothetical protein
VIQGDKPKQHAPGKDTTPGSPAELAWDVFLLLLNDNKTSVFELHAFVTLDVESSST